MRRIHLPVIKPSLLSYLGLRNLHVTHRQICRGPNGISKGMTTPVEGRTRGSFNINFTFHTRPHFPQITASEYSTYAISKLRLQLRSSTSNTQSTERKMTPVKMLPNVKLMARAFRRVAPAMSGSTSTSTSTSPSIRNLSTTPTPRKWEGRQADEHATREKDSHNVQHDAVKEGKAERAEGADGKGAGSRGTSEKAGGSNEKAQKEFPEAPDTIGMQDERGGKA